MSGSSWIIPSLTISLWLRARSINLRLFTIEKYGAKSAGAKMTKKDDTRNRRQTILEGVKAAIAQALERHRRLGQSIAVWQDGKVVILEAHQIPPPPESRLNQAPFKEPGVP